ncbi:hypothetical protein IU486_28170 [Streptomyces gardneri]|nr:hypothetical protein [Streptomyces gardneri]
MFRILPPHALPTTRADLRFCPAVGEAFAALAVITPAWSDYEALEQVRSVTLPEETAPLHPAARTLAGALDHAFEIQRVSGTTALVHSVLTAYRILLEEAINGGVSLTPRQWGTLRLAFSALCRFAVDGTPPPVAAALTCRVIAPHGHRDSLGRWIRGHHVFIVLLQWISIALHVMVSHVASGEIRRARDALATACLLMRGSAMALRFTGDFPSGDYEQHIRPTLLPPAAPPKMTGLHWADHRYLARSLTTASPVLADPPHQMLAWRNAFHRALQDTYESHKFVCAEFLGPSGSTPVSSASGSTPIGMLNRLKIHRTQLAVNPTRAPRDTALPE